METPMMNLNEALLLAKELGPLLNDGSTAKAAVERLKPTWIELRRLLTIGLNADMPTIVETVEAVAALRNWYSTYQAEGGPEILLAAANAMTTHGSVDEVDLVKNRELQGNLWRFRGDTLVRKGDDIEAEKSYRTAIKVYDGMFLRWKTSCQRGLGDIAWRSNSFDQAETLFQEANHGFRNLTPEPDFLGKANTERRLGNCALQRGDAKLAMGYYENAYRYYDSKPGQADQPDCLIGMARVELSQFGQYKAIEYIDAAVKLFRKLGDRLGLSRALALRAQVWRVLEHKGHADLDQAEADSVHHELGKTGHAEDVIR